MSTFELTVTDRATETISDSGEITLPGTGGATVPTHNFLRPSSASGIEADLAAAVERAGFKTYLLSGSVVSGSVVAYACDARDPQPGESVTVARVRIG